MLLVGFVQGACWRRVATHLPHVVVDANGPRSAAWADAKTLSDALKQAGVSEKDGKLIPRRGPRLAFTDSEALCVAVLQDLLHFESDNAYYLWLERNAVMRKHFPNLPTRQKFAERRAVLTPLLQRLCKAFCALGGEAAPPFAPSIPIRSRCAI